MPGTNTNSGTVVSMSATLPSTYDASATTGYLLPVYTVIGEVIDVGEIAKVWTLTTHQALGRLYPEKNKDKYDIGDLSMTMGRVNNDVGQVLLATAMASNASYTFRVAVPGGDFEYFTGKVTKVAMGSIASGANSSTTVSIAINPETLFEV